ncbi:MAG: ATP-binding cassette domain-containing protein [Bacilli bacterium]|nr:ATP-binding cassette domain-containing protein [Bacilli bacterium]
MKIVLQDGFKDCGVCSLLSIIRFYGGEVSKEYLREITNTTKNGVSAFNLIEGARKLGFDAYGVCGDMTNLKNNNLPCIAHLLVSKEYKHFVVIYKIDEESKKLMVMDPAKGKRIMSFSEFKLHSTNNFILLKPIKGIPSFNNKRMVLKTIRNIFYENKKIFLILLFLILVYFLLNILVSFSFKYLLKFSIEYNVSTNIEIISFVIFNLYILKSFSEFLKNFFVLKVSSIIDEKITIKTFKQILLLPYLYYKNRTTGEVITRLKDLTIVKNYLINLFSTIIIDGISVILFLVILFSFSKTITIIILVLVLLILIVSFIRNIKQRKLYLKVSKGEEKVNSYLYEALSNVDTIKGGHIEKRLSDKFLIIYKDLLEKNYIYLVFENISKFIKDNIMGLLNLVVYCLGCILILKDKISIGDIMLYQSFLMYFINGLSGILRLIEEYHNYKISLDRVEDLYTLTSEKFNGSYYYYGYLLDGDIKFNNLSYKYGNKLILNSINLVIKRGEKILLTGESGSGKSSLVKILMRYLEVPYGMCSISDIDINHYHLDNIRKNISYVSSNEFLFTDSLYNNLTLEKDVLDDELNEVCKITKVNEILQKRDSNYKMMVEENGFNFSNGERQRIILCRYLLRKSNIYIFDEAFGQIDIDKEREILKNVFLYLKDKTVIVISHRVNNKDLFDRWISLKDGKIYEEKL